MGRTGTGGWEIQIIGNLRHRLHTILNRKRVWEKKVRRIANEINIEWHSIVPKRWRRTLKKIGNIEYIAINIEQQKLKWFFLRHIKRERERKDKRKEEVEMFSFFLPYGEDEKSDSLVMVKRWKLCCYADLTGESRKVGVWGKKRVSNNTARWGQEEERTHSQHENT